jgi:hypothetical protein
VPLFLHVTGVLTMFAGIALEAFGGEPAGKAPQRISKVSGPLTVLPGIYLAARFGVLLHEWLLASYLAIVVMMIAETVARRSAARRGLSLRVRATFGLAVVFLMIAKPDAAVSLVVLAVAAAASWVVALPSGLKQQPGGLSSTRA